MNGCSFVVVYVPTRIKNESFEHSFHGRFMGVLYVDTTLATSCKNFHLSTLLYSGRRAISSAFIIHVIS